MAVTSTEAVAITKKALRAAIIMLLFTCPLQAQQLQKITYLYNSGWLIETSNAIILLDYVPDNNIPSEDVLFKKLKQERNSGKGVYILITHEHDDHFHKPLLEWHHRMEDLTTIVGWELVTGDKSILKVYDGKSLTAGAMKVVSHPSTDAGSGFLVTIGDLTFYHAGDHAAWDHDMMREFTGELKKIKKSAPTIHLAFIPIARGKMGACKVTDSITEGALLAVDILKPDILFPMHLQCGDMTPYHEFSKLVNKKFSSVTTMIPSSYNFEFEF